MSLEERDKARFYPSAINDSKSLKDAMAKYGKEHFTVEILQDGIMHPEIVKLRERYWIRHFDDYHNGYNCTQGGDGVDSETASEVQGKRVEAGTHHFTSEFARENARKQVANGTHPLLGENNPVYKRIADGTHNFQDKSFYSRRSYFHRIRYKNQRREFYRYVSVILTAKSVCNERIYRKRIREGFFDKEIPDTSKSKQLDLFNH